MLLAIPFYITFYIHIIYIFFKIYFRFQFRFTYMVTFYCAVYCISLIAIDRFFAVFLVWRYREIVTTKRAWMCIIFLWTYIVLLCIVPFRYPQGHVSMEGIFEELPISNNSDSASLWDGAVVCRYNQSKYWTVSMLTYNCLLPYLGVVLIHRFVAGKIRGLAMRRRNASFRIDHEEQRDNDETRKMTKVAHMLTISYLMTWLPSVTYYIMWSACPTTCFSKTFKGSYLELYVGFFTKYLAFMDAILSPLIYCFFSEQFRNLIPCLKEVRRKRMSSTLTSA